MTKKTAKLIIQKTSTTHEVKILKAVVRKEGKRTVDTAEFKLSSSVDVNENDRVKYIQDINDVTNLTAVYNFQGNTKDEGGYDLDGDDSHDGVVNPSSDITVSSKDFENTSSVSPRYYMNYGIVYTGTKTTIANNSKFDFSKQFDIICSGSSRVVSGGSSGSVGDKKIFFSKMDSSGNGIEVGIIKNSVGFDSFWTGYARVRFNSTEREYKQSWSYNSSNSAVEGKLKQAHVPFTLRLWRAEDNLLRFSFNSYEDGSWYNGSTSLNSKTLDTTNSSSSDTPTPPHTLANTQAIWIGAGRDGSNNATNTWDGIAFQLKIYTGGYLDYNDSELLQMSGSTPTTMKFNGKVFSIKDNTKNKIVNCKGDGEVILNYSFNSSQFDNSTPNDSSYVTRVSVDGTKKNIYAAGSTTDDIMKSLIALADSSFSFVVGTGAGTHTMVGNLVAEGSFLANVKTILNGMSDSSFWSNGRKTFFLEKSAGIATGIKYTSNQGDESRSVRILEMGRSNNYLVNSVELIGRQSTKHRFENAGTVSNGTVKTLNFHPVNMRITDGSGNILIQDSDYTVNYDERKITFSGSKSGVVVEYDYEDVSSSSDVYYLGNNTSSINTYGEHYKRFFVPQLTHRTDFQRLANKLVSSTEGDGETSERYQIELPYLANNIRENHKVKVINKKTGSSGTDLVIKQIEWHYPSSKTIIQVGENLIDGFDLEQSDSLTLSSSISSIQKTKT